jgi:hypothetical protein
MAGLFWQDVVLEGSPMKKSQALFLQADDEALRKTETITAGGAIPKTISHFPTTRSSSQSNER